MRQKRLLLSYPAYPIFPNYAVKGGRRNGTTATDAIGRLLLKTTLFSKKGKSSSDFEQAAGPNHRTRASSARTES
jgi:hypothetical protein